MALGTTSAALLPHWRSRGAHAVALALSLLAPDEAVAGTRSATGRAADPPRLFPTPRSVSARSEEVRIPASVTLVRGAATDAGALAVVRRALRDAGVRTIEQVDDRAPVRGRRLVVHVGGHQENGASANALITLGVQGAETMAAEGYVLAVGAGRDGHDRIVLSGADAAGTYYAARTLHRLMDGPRLRGTVIRDWPCLRRRGVIEPLSGPPRSHQQRLDALEWCGRHKMNAYLCAPGDAPYSTAELARVGELVRRATAHHVTLGCVLAPHAVCPSEAAEPADGVESLWEQGVRSFAIAFDGAAEARGTSGRAAAAARARLVDAAQQALCARHPEAEPIGSVRVDHGGAAVSAPHSTAPVPDARPAEGSPPVRLLLGPLAGHRSVPKTALGPAPLSRASRIPLFAVADHGWNPSGYDAERSWAAAIDELAGRDARAADALRAFAGVHRSSPPVPRPATELTAHIAHFRRTGRTAPLRRTLRAVQEAPGVLRDRLADREFVRETGPWLDATERWARAALMALDMLAARRAGGERAARAAQVPLAALVEHAMSCTRPAPGSPRPVRVGLDPAVEEFVLTALREPEPVPAGSDSGTSARH